MHARSIKTQLGLILIALGLASAASLLEPLHSDTMNLSWGLIAFPVGILVLPGAGFAHATRITLRCVAALVVITSLAMAVAVVSDGVPVAPEFQLSSHSPWFWIQTGLSTMLVAIAIWIGGDFLARITDSHSGKGLAGPGID
jgi:hypothetical protein